MANDANHTKSINSRQLSQGVLLEKEIKGALVVAGCGVKIVGVLVRLVLILFFHDWKDGSAVKRV